MMRKDYEMYYNERLSQCEVCLNKRIDKKSNCGIYEEKPDYVLNSEKECLKYSSENPLVINSDNIEFLALLGGIFGFCIGDVLGVPVEFLPREEMKKDKVNEMRAYGTYDQYYGAWSDDTSLTLCLIDSLRNGYNINDIADNYLKVLRRNGKYFQLDKSKFQSLNENKKRNDLLNYFVRFEDYTNRFEANLNHFKANKLKILSTKDEIYLLNNIVYSGNYYFKFKVKDTNENCRRRLCKKKWR